MKGAAERSYRTAVPFKIARHYFCALCQRPVGYASGGRACDVKSRVPPSLLVSLSPFVLSIRN